MASQQPPLPSTQTPQAASSQPAVLHHPAQQSVQSGPQQGVQLPPPQPAAAAALDPHAESLYVGGTYREIVCRHPSHNGNYPRFAEGQENLWELHYQTHLNNPHPSENGTVWCGYCSATRRNLQKLKKHVQCYHNTRAGMTIGFGISPAVVTQENGRRMWTRDM